MKPISQILCRRYMDRASGLYGGMKFHALMYVSLHITATKTDKHYVGSSSKEGRVKIFSHFSLQALA